MNMKKMIAFMLASAMLMPTTAYASENGAYDEHVEFSNSFLWMEEGTDYTDEDLYRWVSDTFNVDIDVRFIANSNHSETLRTWIQGDTLPDAAIWSEFNMPEYKSYAEQGLISPLPDGWEEDYPNLYQMVLKTGIYENLKIDGKTYAIPHAVYCNFVDVEAPVPVAETTYYRKDWAEELGFDFAGKDTVTVSEFEEYLKACVENDMSGTGTVGIATDSNELLDQYLVMLKGLDADYNSFIRDDEVQQYVWTPEAEADEIVEGITELRDWYQNGLIDPDFYNADYATAQNKFTAGMAAAYLGRGHVHGIIGLKNELEAANEDLTYEDTVGMVTVTNDDGSFYFVEQTNYYTHTIFSPNLDETTMARILSIMDFFSTKEGQYYMYCGVKGQDWDYDENGEVASGIEYPSSMMWCFMSIVSDDFSFGNPIYPKDIRETSIDMIERLKETGTPKEYNYEYQFYSSDAKSYYSVDEKSKIVELITSDVDIADGWTEFINQFDAMVNPILEDLNATYY